MDSNHHFSELRITLSFTLSLAQPLPRSLSNRNRSLDVIFTGCLSISGICFGNQNSLEEPMDYQGFARFIQGSDQLLSLVKVRPTLGIHNYLYLLKR